MFKCKIIIIILYLISPLLIAEKLPDTVELLDRVSESQNKLKSLIVKGKSHTAYNSSYNGKHSHLSGKKEKFELFELRSDGDHGYLSINGWGDLYSQRPKDNPLYTSYLWDGKWFWRNAKKSGLDKISNMVTINKSIDKNRNKRLFSQGFSGHSMMGYYYGDDERIDSVLKESNEISIREEKERVGKSECYVIDALSNNGKYTVWIDPQHDYHIVKAQIEKSENNLFYGKYLSKGDQKIELLEVTHFENIDGVWIPTEANIIISSKMPNGDSWKAKQNIQLTEIALNPNHDSLGSFTPNDIANGSRVRIVGVKAIYYTWQDGELIPNVDKLVMKQIDTEVGKFMEEKMNPRYEPYAIMEEANGAGLKRKSESLTTPTDMTVSELMAKYQASQNQLQSFIAKGESAFEIAGKSSEISQMEKTISEFRYDGSRVNYRVRSLNDEISTCKACYESFVWDGKSFVEYRQGSDWNKSRASVSRYDSDKNKMIAKKYKGAALMGICCGDYERIDLILGKARSISLRDKTDTIGGSECYVIEANTKRGKYKVWIDPDHGYNIARIEVQKNKRDLINYMEPLKAKMSFLLKNACFEKIDNVWVPMEADMQQTENNGNKITRWHHKRIEFVPNPDHNTLKSFVPDDIPDGTKVKLTGDSKKYKWQKGRPVALVVPRRLKRILPSQKDDTCVWQPL